MCAKRLLRLRECNKAYTSAEKAVYVGVALLLGAIIFYTAFSGLQSLTVDQQAAKAFSHYYVEARELYYGGFEIPPYSGHLPPGYEIRLETSGSNTYVALYRNSTLIKRKML